MFTGIGIGMVSQRTATSLQALLFGQSEPGFTFEPWDMTTLYQDRAGTTPVTAAGQSVGLRLDKSKGLALGTELVDTANTASAWVSYGANTVTQDGDTVRINFVDTAAGAYLYLTQAGGLSSNLVSGKSYQMQVQLRINAGSANFSIYSTSLGNYIDDQSITGTDYVTRTYIFQYISGSPYIQFANLSVGESVWIRNISVRELAGNHEVAMSDAKRGVYGWMPKTGRRNLLTYTEQFDNAAWTKTNTTVTTDATAAPDGTNTADKLSETATTASHYAYETYTSTGVRIVYSVYAKAAERRRIAVWEGTTSANGAVFDLISGTVVNNLAAGVGSIQSVGDGWYRCSVTSIETAGTRWLVCSVLLDDATGVGGTVGVAGSGIYIWGAQLELGSTATAYQRVVSQYDITEAGVPTCYYVQADGVDDAYVTPTITPNTDKVQVFAGVRKLSDAAVGIVIELSTDQTTNAGSFVVAAPLINATANYGFSARGSALQSYAASSGFAAPITNVLTGLGDISGDLTRLRVNGVQVGQSTADRGTGNFLAYPAYLYARGGTSLPFNGLDFGHAVRFGPNLDAATIARVESLIARNTPEVDFLFGGVWNDGYAWNDNTNWNDGA